METLVIALDAVFTDIERDLMRSCPKSASYACIHKRAIACSILPICATFGHNTFHRTKSQSAGLPHLVVAEHADAREIALVIIYG
eukprot:3085225-Pleurochrysis_carterae.AAC.2